MNEQKAPGGIEWTRINGRRGFTWNPTAGCLHGCTWRMPDGKIAECYAKTVAERISAQNFTRGFEHHYWNPERLNEPLKLKDPAGVFVGSMADLFGHWTPATQIQQVIGVMKAADWHIFQTLSKNPHRLSEFNPYPANVWVGVSLPAGHLMSAEGGARALLAYLHHMEEVEATVRFMSIEPLWFDVAPVFKEYLRSHTRLPFEWAIIGAASNGATIYQPDSAWVSRLMGLLDDANVPIFMKGNIRENPAVEHIRAEFPMIVQPKAEQMRMF